MSIEGEGHFFSIYSPGFVCFVLYLAKISGERLQDHWSSGLEFISYFRQDFQMLLMVNNETMQPSHCALDHT